MYSENSIIRTATFQDLPQIKALALKAWLFAYKDIYSESEIRAENEKFYTEDFHRRILQRTAEGLHVFKVLENSQQIQGLADCDFRGKDTILTRLYLSPEIIGQGYGKKLLQTLEAEMVHLGRQNYRLLSHARNRLGIAFYQRNGFVRNPQFDQTEDEELCFEKVLPS